MLARVPRLPFSLDPLIAEAKRRMRRRRIGTVVALVLLAVIGGGVFALTSPSSGPGSSGRGVAGIGVVTRVSAQGVGGVRFGASKAATVAALTRILGPPSRRFVSDACGPRYTEVEWNQFYAEFRLNRFSGYRYMRADWLPRGVIPIAARLQVRPLLTTANGLSIGSTLRQVQEHYGNLRPVGTDRWQSRDGLVFYVGSATPQPPPPESRITEIKIATCGDF